MNRRNFLKLFASASAAAGLGIAVPVAIASTPLYSVRYIEAYDVLNDRMVSRLDFSRAGVLEVPPYIARGAAYQDVRKDQLLDVCDLMRKESHAIPVRQVLQEILSDMKEHDIFCISLEPQ